MVPPFVLFISVGVERIGRHRAHRRAATAIAESATSDEDQEKVRSMCRNMAGFKLDKFDSIIYDAYA
jgi:hypothetical protein